MELYILFIIIIATTLITLFFILSLLLPFTFRRRKIEKIQFLDIDRSTKALGAWDFFYSILKMENTSKAFHYVEILFLVIDGLFILIGVYVVNHGEVKLPEVSTDLKDTMLLLFIEPIILWLITLFLFLFAMYMKKKENKRITEMLNDLEKAKILNSAQKDFFKSNEIVRVGKLSNDIKLGDKFIFTIYPAYIIPYSWIKDVKVTTTFVRNGTRYYLNFIFKNSWKPLKIFSPKEILAEEIKNLILNKKNLNEKGVF